MTLRVSISLLLGGFFLLSSGTVLAQTSGDLNGDGKVDAADVTILEEYLKGSRLLVDQEVSQADVNQDGKVDSKDLAALRQQLGLVASDSSVPVQTNQRNQRGNRDQSASTEASKEGKTSTFQLGISEAVPEWVRGEWRFLSTVVEERGFNSMGQTHNEQITLPGDLSGQYQAYSDETGERLERLCWQVLESDTRHFVFTEQLRFQSNSAVIRSTATVSRLEPDQAQIRVHVEVLDPGRAGESQGVLGGLLGALFGGGSRSSPSRPGDYYVRSATMNRTPGTEQRRLPNVDLNRLRCS
jgi:Dockerin type I domain